MTYTGVSTSEVSLRLKLPATQEANVPHLRLQLWLSPIFHYFCAKMKFQWTIQNLFPEVMAVSSVFLPNNSLQNTTVFVRKKKSFFCDCFWSSLHCLAVNAPIESIVFLHWQCYSVGCWTAAQPWWLCRTWSRTHNSRTLSEGVMSCSS